MAADAGSSTTLEDHIRAARGAQRLTRGQDTIPVEHFADARRRCRRGVRNAGEQSGKGSQPREPSGRSRGHRAAMSA
jgi:hypothetical protein